MNKFVGILLLCVLLSACAGTPPKQDTLFAACNVLVVRPIDWNQTIFQKMNDNEIAEFKAAQPALSELFRTNFDKQIKETGYFDQIIYGNDMPPQGALVLEPKIAHIDPGIRWVINGDSEYKGTVRDISGNVVGIYTSRQTVGRPIYSSMMGAIESLVKDSGEDAAAKLPNVTRRID